MSLGKKDIVKNISTKAPLSIQVSSKILEAFLALVKENRSKKTMIVNFGTFYPKHSPSRLGRNPKTKEEFKIKPRTKLNFKASNNIKKIFN